MNRSVLITALGTGIVVAVALTAYVLLRPRGDDQGAREGEASAQRLTQAIAEADRLDPGWRFADLEKARAAVAEEANAAPQVRRAAELIPERWTSVEIRLIRNRLHRRPDGPSVSSREEMAPLEAALVEGRKLAGLSRGRHEVRWNEINPLNTPLPHVNGTRLVADLLALDGEVRAHEGNGDGAVTSCRAALNAGRVLGDEPMLESQLVRAGVHDVVVQALEEVLARAEPPEPALAALQQALEEEAAEPLLQIAARGHRAGLHELMLTLESGELDRHALAAGGIAAGEHSLTAGVRTILNDPALYHTTSLRYAHAWLLEYMTQFVEITQLPLHEQQARLEELMSESTTVPPAAKPLVPSLRDITLVYQRSQALLRSAVLAVAAERYRRALGRWPDKAADLVPKYVRDIPTDPFDGKPFRLAAHKPGIVFYAVELDGKDDGGKFEELNSYRDGSDLGFRLWHPEQRRKRGTSPSTPP